MLLNFPIDHQRNEAIATQICWILFLESLFQPHLPIGTDFEQRELCQFGVNCVPVHTHIQHPSLFPRHPLTTYSLKTRKAILSSSSKRGCTCSSHNICFSGLLKTTALFSAASHSGLARKKKLSLFQWVGTEGDEVTVVTINRGWDTLLVSLLEIAGIFFIEQN